MRAPHGLQAATSPVATTAGYMPSFDNDFKIKALPDAWLTGKNAPLKVAYSLLGQQLIGTAFTAPGHQNERYDYAPLQVAHHASSGCAMTTADLLGSGTISGTEKHLRASLL